MKLKLNFPSSSFAAFWFYVFISAHIFVWTLAPLLVRHTLPMDAIEGAMWGQHFAFGYDKNPFLNGWLTELAILIGGHHGILTYLWGQLAVAICFWAIWKLACEWLSPIHALIAVILLEWIPRYNLDAIDFNDNVLQLCLWALILLFFYRALSSGLLRNWILTGLFAALAMLSKYFVVVLFIVMGLFVLTNKDARRSLYHPGIYIALLLFIALLIPHVLWLFHHDFITINYAFERTGSYVHLPQSLYDHIANTYSFLLLHFYALITPLVLYGLLFLFKESTAKATVFLNTVISYSTNIPAFGQQFLLWMAFGPFIVLTVFGVVFGLGLHSGWGQPLLSLFGILLVSAVQLRITRKQWLRWIVCSFLLLMVFVGAYMYSIWTAKNTSSANYPATEIASQLTEEWHKQYNRKLSYVIGPRFEAGVLSLYSLDRPSVYVNADSRISFWIDEKSLQKEGAIAIWPSTEKSWYETLKKRYPSIEKSKEESFPWIRGHNVLPVSLMVAFIPPQK